MAVLVVAPALRTPPSLNPSDIEASPKTENSTDGLVVKIPTLRFLDSKTPPETLAWP